MKSNVVKDINKEYILTGNLPEWYFIGAIRGILAYARTNPAEHEDSLRRIQELLDFLEERMENEKKELDARIKQAHKECETNGPGTNGPEED